MAKVRVGLRAEDVILDTLIAIIMVAFVFSIIFPFWSLLVDSFSDVEFARRPGIKLWPLNFSIRAYREVLNKEILGIAYFNTVFRTVVGTIILLILTLGAAYGLSKRRLPGRRILTMIFVFTMFFTGGLIPTYLLIRSLGLLNTRFVLVFPFLVQPFSLLVMRNFMYSIPSELEESAFMDGANEITILIRIIVPLSIPIIATVSLWTAVNHWNEWFASLIYTTRTDLIVVQLILRRLLIENIPSSQFEGDLNEQGAQMTEETIRAATLFISIGPIIALYPFLQRYFVKGTLVGAVKQ
jgi:putative aldouronate transport system permease protein